MPDSQIFYDNQINPRTEPLRFTDQEKAIFEQGLCCYQTGYGLPGVTYCEQPSAPGADFGHCYSHAGGYPYE